MYPVFSGHDELPVPRAYHLWGLGMMAPDSWKSLSFNFCMPMSCPSSGWLQIPEDLGVIGFWKGGTGLVVEG